MIVTPFQPWHLEELRLQPAQASFGGCFDDPEYVAMLARSDAFTGLVNGVPVVCSGCLELWENRAIAWALFASAAGRNMVAVHRAVARYLAQAKWRRIEATVDPDFDAAQRWIRALGFRLEGTMRAYTPDGRDNDLFARVRYG